MNSTEAEVELKYEALLGESPVWDEQQEVLYWVDIVSGKLCEYEPKTHINISYTIEDSLGAVALREKRGLLLATGSGFAFYDKENKQISPVEDPESHLPDNRFNDGKCGPAGRFWAGTMSESLDEGAGKLYCLRRNKNIELKLQNLTISNGMGWNREHDLFYLIDSPTGEIQRFNYDKESGEIAKTGVVKTFSDSDGLPDGMTVDEEGGIWVALYNGGKVLNINPTNGKVLHEVILPVPKVTSCTFGGANLNELYITTAREHMSAGELEKYPLSGSLFKAKVPVKGMPSFRYAG